MLYLLILAYLLIGVGFMTNWQKAVQQNMYLTYDNTTRWWLRHFWLVRIVIILLWSVILFRLAVITKEPT